MNQTIKSKLVRTRITFWLLFLYVVAALIWWFISLEKQNNYVLNLKLYQTEEKLKLTGNQLSYAQENRLAIEEHKRNRVKYLGEGIVFLGLILIGAVILFRSIRKQLLMQMQQQNFMMAVTHELKTPIAITKLNLETLLKYQLDEAKQKKILRIAIDETSRLNFLTNNILVSSQLEGKRFSMTTEELNLSLLLRDKVAMFKIRYPDRTFNIEIDEDVDIKGDVLLLEILINNLLENAIKYSDKTSAIRAVLLNHTTNVVLKIIDEGEGIPDEEKKKVFAKFYRIGDEATRKKRGTGLGLYLCHQIAIDHHAHIWIEDNHPKGSIFIVKFPI